MRARTARWVAGCAAAGSVALIVGGLVLAYVDRHLKDLQLSRLRIVRSSLVLARKPSMRPGRVFTSTTQLVDVLLGEVGQRSFHARPDAFHRFQLGRISRELEDRQPRAGGDQLPHRAAGVGGKVVPDQDHRPAELLMGAVQQAGILGLGEPLAAMLAGPAVQVGAVDQPRPFGGVAGPGGDQRGDRDALASLGGHRRYRSAAAAAPGASLGRPQALAGLVLEAEPGAQVRRRPFMTGQVSSRQAAIAASSRSAARRAGTWTLHPIRCSSTSSPAGV
jgi:hypothetical protein